MKILLVDDDPRLRDTLRRGLEHAGHEAVAAASADEAEAALSVQHFDLLLLDVMMPGRDGWELLEALRARGVDVPVIFLTARDAVEERVRGLSAGADDYLTKPFSVGELLARVRALLRRAEGERGREVAQLRFGEVEVDLARRVVTRAGQPVHLTAIEFRLLATLLANAGKVMTHRQLLHQVWGPGYAEATHYLRVYVGHLRQKLEADPLRPAHFRTEIGVGYRFQD